MRKHVVKEFKMIDDGDMSAQIISNLSNVTQLDISKIRLKWSGSSITGEFFIETRSSDKETFEVVDFGAPITVTTDAGFHDIIFNEMPFNEMQVRFENTTGTGTVDATLTSKTIGA